MRKDFRVSLGRRIRQFRVASGMTQCELAAAMGCTFQNLQKIERGQNRVSADQIVAIRDTLGISYGHLLAGGIESVSTSRLDLNLARRIQCLTPDQKRVLTTLLDSFTNQTERKTA